MKVLDFTMLYLLYGSNENMIWNYNDKQQCHGKKMVTKKKRMIWKNLRFSNKIQLCANFDFSKLNCEFYLDKQMQASKQPR